MVRNLVWLLIGAVGGPGVVAGVGAGMFALARVVPPGRAKELIGFAPNCVVLLRRLRADTGLPWRVRAVLGLALAYVVSPVQLIPNVIPVVGQSDDMTVVALALRYACRLGGLSGVVSPDHLVLERYAKAASRSLVETLSGASDARLTIQSPGIDSAGR